MPAVMDKGMEDQKARVTCKFTPTWGWDTHPLSLSDDGFLILHTPLGDHLGIPSHCTFSTLDVGRERLQEAGFGNMYHDLCSARIHR